MAWLIDLRCLVSKPRSRPATAKLATNLLTSHSNGPGSVSSKSLTLKTSCRSGAAKHTEVGQMRVAAQLHRQVCAGRARQIGGHQVGGTAVEREWRRPTFGRNGSGPAPARDLRPAPQGGVRGPADPRTAATPVHRQRNQSSRRLPRAARSAIVGCST